MIKTLREATTASTMAKPTKGGRAFLPDPGRDSLALPQRRVRQECLTSRCKRLPWHTSPARLALAIILLLAAQTTRAAIDLAAFKYIHPTTAESDREEIAAVPLNSEVWDGAARGAIDLRVVTCHFDAVPHILRRRTRSETRLHDISCSATMSGFKELPGNRIELEVRTAADKPVPTRLRFATPLKDFERRLSVWGLSPDGSSVPLVEDALIYDYSRFADVRNCDVTLPGNTYRSLKVVIDAVTDDAQSPHHEITRTLSGDAETKREDTSRVTTRPFRMDSVKALASEAQETRRKTVMMSFEPNAWQISTNGADTVIDIDTHHEPTTGFMVETPARNFSRPITVQVSGSEGGMALWRDIGQSRLSRIAFRSFKREALSVSFPEQQARRFRLIIKNGDSSPLSVTGIRGEGPQWEALFLADPAHNHFLYYGGPAVAANYDTDHLARVLAKDFEPVTFPLTAREANPKFRPVPAQVKGFVGSRLFFIFVVVLMVGVLGFGLVKAGKQAVAEE